jgi:hypothetical protein
MFSGHSKGDENLDVGKEGIKAYDGSLLETWYL